jgi:hypothetical protein
MTKAKQKKEYTITILFNEEEMKDKAQEYLETLTDGYSPEEYLEDLLKDKVLDHVEEAGELFEDFIKERIG